MSVKRLRQSVPHPGAIASVGLAAFAAQQLLGSVGVDAAVITGVGELGVATAAGGLGVIAHRHTRRGRVRRRYGHDGWVNRRDLLEHLGLVAVRTKAIDVRPSLASKSLADLKRMPFSEFGFRIGRTVTGPVIPRPLYFSHKEVTMVYAPPQTGKTALLGNFVLDAPGAVIATSTKTDLYSRTAPVRAGRDKTNPISVFNPERLGNVESTFCWDPTAGCEDPMIAQERASYLVSGASDKSAKDAKFWEDQAVSVLRCYLMAAALDQDRNILDVNRWVSSAHEDTPERILATFPQVVPSAWLDSLAHIKGDSTPQNTRGSIFVTLRLAVAFVGDPEVAKACVPKDGQASFNVEEFVNSKATLYLIGSERQHATIAPLLTALTGYIFEECKRLAARKRGERHDPPVTFVLDEAALIVPVPLPQWSSDAGGQGIAIVFAVQCPSQLVHRWGREGADIIQNNAVVKVVFGGLTNFKDLEAVSSVAGQRREENISESVEAGGARVPRTVSSHWARTITTDGLRMLPTWHVLVLYRSANPVIAKIRPVWKRSDVRRAVGVAELSQWRERDLQDTAGEDTAV
jgi:type IV secretory pathway TraG/TraD family ATPase VirD4